MWGNDLLIGFAAGLGVGGGMVALAVRPRLAEREAALREQKKLAEAERVKADAWQAELRDAVAAAGRADELRANLRAREEEVYDLSRRLGKATASLAGVTAELDVARSAHLAAMAQKDEEVARLLAHNAVAVKDLLAAKDHAVAEQHRAKDAALAEQRRLLDEAECVLTEKFGAVSLKSLNDASEQFVKLAGERFAKHQEASKSDLEARRREIEHLLGPLAEALRKIEAQHREIEERRVSAFDRIERGIEALSQEADQLANALRKPSSRGAWGEMQLQIILENAGMVEGQHFTIQHSSDGEEGRLRTDVVLRMPRGRLFVIDAKAPLESYWEGMNAPDEPTRRLRFAAHARVVREHVNKLGNKQYWRRYPEAPDCVVMFLPTEGAYQAAFEADRALLAEAHQMKVYVANPMTLMSMVHVAACVLNEEKLRDNAHEVRTVGVELYRRLAKFLGDLDGLGRHLKLAVGEYNRAIGSVDGRLMPQARRMKELGAGAEEMPTLEPIDVDPRAVSSPDTLWTVALPPN